MSNKTRNIEIEKVAETEITAHSVFHAEFDDTGSWLRFIPDSERDVLRITHVESRLKGDMSTIIDHIVPQVETNNVRFMIPLDGPLSDKLNDFELVEETLPGPDGDNTVECLAGVWETE